MTEEGFSLGLVTTPELYAGYKFARAPLGNSEGAQPGKTVEYELPQTLEQNKIILEGLWKNNADDLELVGESGKVILIYTSRFVNIVAQSTSNAVIENEVFLNTTYVPEIKAGKDVYYKNNKAMMNVLEPRLYEVFGKGNAYGQNKLELRVQKGFSFNAFTFGS